jgi:toxin ParE1/3/4
MVAHLRAEAGPPVALASVDDLERSLAAIAAHPAAGSPRYAHALDIPGLRFRRLVGFPCLVFYVERPDGVDVLRILHGTRDMPTTLRTAEDG